jgi:hypothetical protein
MDDRSFSAGFFNGKEVQHSAHACIDLLRTHDIQIRIATISKAEENSYNELLILIIKEDDLVLPDCRNFHDAS